MEYEYLYVIIYLNTAKLSFYKSVTVVLPFCIYMHYNMPTRAITDL